MFFIKYKLYNLHIYKWYNIFFSDVFNKPGSIEKAILRKTTYWKLSEPRIYHNVFEDRLKNCGSSVKIFITLDWVKKAQVLHLQLSTPQSMKTLIFIDIDKVKSFQIMKLPSMNEQSSIFSAQMSKQTFTNQ